MFSGKLDLVGFVILDFVYIYIHVDCKRAKSWYNSIRIVLLYVGLRDTYGAVLVIFVTCMFATVGLLAVG